MIFSRSQNLASRLFRRMTFRPLFERYLHRCGAQSQSK